MASAAGGGDGDAVTEAEAIRSTIKPVGVVLNGVARQEPWLVATIGHDLLVLREDLAAMGLQAPERAVGLVVDGRALIRLSALSGVTGSLSEDEATLVLRANPEAFGASRDPTTSDRRGMPLSPIVPMAFLGYDVSLARSASGVEPSGLLDGGVSGAWGVAGTTALLQPGTGRVVRLESHVQRDWPERRLRLVVGDTISRGGELGNAVRFGGIRFGTDFSLAPEVINSPVPLLAGSTLTPSTVELLATTGGKSLEVGPGRFLIEAPPTISGTGEVVMTIRDATGSIQRIRQSFYSSNRLLRPGLDDFSVEAGVLRRRFGERSVAYGSPFAAASWRRGIANALTAGSRIEASREALVGGVTFNTTLSSWCEVGVVGAVSRSRFGAGSLVRAQVQRLSRRGSITASYSASSAAFHQVGEERFEQRRGSRHELAASAGLSLAGGEVSVGVVDAKLRDGSRYRLGTFGYSTSFRSFNLIASVTSIRFTQGSERGFLLSLSRPFGRGGSSAIIAERGVLTSSLQQTAPFAGGWSYGLASSRSASGTRVNGYAIRSSPIGDLELTASLGGGEFQARATVRGALVFIDNRLVPTPRLQDGVALVEVAGNRRVGLLQEGRPVARRAGAGRAVVLTGLQPYLSNRVAISFDDLPADVEVDAEEQVAVPGYRQAAAIRFGKVTTTTPLTVRLVGDDGDLVAVGSAVSQGGRRIGVAGHDGLVFLKDALGGATLTVGNAGARCTVSLPVGLTASDGGIAGPFRCRSIIAREAAR